MPEAARPVIGLNADYRPATKVTEAQFVLDVGYADLVLRAGGLPLPIPPLTPSENNKDGDIEAYLDMVDGLILTYGADLDPRRAGEGTHPSVRPMPERREAFDRKLLRSAHERRLPVLGTGVGIQLINVHFGGSLHLHLPEAMPRAMPHRDEPGEPHRHLVLLEPKTTMEDIYGDCELRVTSDHHQAVHEVAEGFRIGARAPDDVIEAIEHFASDWFCIGVQWHPQNENASALDMQLMDRFMEACRRGSQPLQLAA